MANYDRPYKFNIVLNSLQSTSYTANVNDCTYQFNWTNIPQGRYRMSFSYRGQNNTDFVADDSPQVFLRMQSVASAYQASNENGSVITTYIGSLRAETHAAGQVYFYANLNDNPDVYFNNVPSNGPIQVLMYKPDFITPYSGQTAGSELAEYVMVLSFELVGKVIGYTI